MDLISVIIPTYNRLKFLHNCVKSCLQQTHSNIEIIIVNDCSTDENYYNAEFPKCQMIHLPVNTKEIYGFVCAAHVRNVGVAHSKGKYIAFCDDDDVWFPRKLELQLKAMKESGCSMCCTEGLFGYGEFDPSKVYKKYNSEHYFDIIKNKFGQNGYKLEKYPKIWNEDFLRIHNCVVCSSVLLEKRIFKIVGNMYCIPPPGEDFSYWIRVCKESDIVYVEDVCFYYDGCHGNGCHY